MNTDLRAIASAIDHLVAAQQKGVWDYIGTIAVILTFGVLVWYTIETYLLRKAAWTQTEAKSKLLGEAQKQNEHSLMPILALVPETVEGASVMMKLPNVYDRLCVRNVGSGPAFNAATTSIAINGHVVEFRHRSVIPQGEQRPITLQFGKDGDNANFTPLNTLLDFRETLFRTVGDRKNDTCSIQIRCQKVV